MLCPERTERRLGTAGAVPFDRLRLKRLSKPLADRLDAVACGVELIEQAHEPVDHPLVLVVFDRDAYRLQSVGVLASLVAKRIEPRRQNGRGRQSREVACEQSDVAPQPR